MSGIGVMESRRVLSFEERVIQALMMNHGLACRFGLRPEDFEEERCARAIQFIQRAPQRWLLALQDSWGEEGHRWVLAVLQSQEPLESVESLIETMKRRVRERPRRKELGA